MNQLQNKKHQKAFTLVELIVVVTILGILTLITYISFGSYATNARDSNRIVTLEQISKALTLNKISTGRYPLPDDVYGTGQILGVDLFHVGRVGERVSRFVNMQGIPVDPLSGSEYLYGLSLDNKHFQIAGTLEQPQAGIGIGSQAYASSSHTAKVQGSYQGVLLFSDGVNRYIGNVPSLIFSRTGTYDLIHSEPSEPYFVVNKATNLPYSLQTSSPIENLTTPEILQHITGNSLSLTGVVLSDWESQSDDLEAVLGYPKDLIGYEIFGKEYVYKLTQNILGNSSSPSFSKIDFGRNHVCGLTPSGGVKCWGQNDNGPLGDGTQIHRQTPLYVPGLESGVIDISSGVHYSCAVLTSGGVKCWGVNWSGNLGNGTTTESPIPVDVIDITNAINVSAGDGHACAVLATGGIKCWGSNNYGLGDGTTTQRTTPVDVIDITNAIKVSAGYEHTCAVLATGGVKCWGNNSDGSLGIGNTPPWESLTPIDVINITNVVEISAGYHHTCAIISDGGVKCWGRGGDGQLGYGVESWDFPANKTSPVDVIGITNALSISTSEFVSCASLSDGGVKCWGRGMNYQLGNGAIIQTNTPVDVVGPIHANFVSIGQYDTCASLSDGGVKCWGRNYSGYIWDGPTSHTPIDVIMPE